VHLFELFRASPLAGISVLLCLITILWCIRVITRRPAGPERFLPCVLGLIAISQGLKVLQDSGIWHTPEPMHRFESFVDLTIAGLYLLVALILEVSSGELVSATVQLRIVEANSGRNPSEVIMACIEPVVVLDGHGCVGRCNDAAGRVLGFSRDDMVGRRILVEPGLHVRQTGEPTRPAGFLKQPEGEARQAVREQA
jgi:PAS domain-containing protein